MRSRATTLLPSPQFCRRQLSALDKYVFGVCVLPTDFIAKLVKHNTVGSTSVSTIEICFAIRTFASHNIATTTGSLSSRGGSFANASNDQQQQQQWRQQQQQQQ
jgi:hypothetical protein